MALGVARGTDFDHVIKSPEVLTLFKTAASVVKYKLPAPLEAKRLHRGDGKGVLVDLSGPVAESMPAAYIPEAIDITRAHALLDKLESAAARGGNFVPEPLSIRPDETERLLREAQKERELAKIAQHETLMLNEGLTPREIASLTEKERERIARKYATPRVTDLLAALKSLKQTQAAIPAPQPPPAPGAPVVHATPFGGSSTPGRRIRSGSFDSPARGGAGGGGGGGGAAGGVGVAPALLKMAAENAFDSTAVGAMLEIEGVLKEPRLDARDGKGRAQKEKFIRTFVEKWQKK